MARFVLGLVCGVAFAIAGTAAAASIVGGDSHLSGLDVVKGGEVVCKDPWATVATRQIECKGE